jgi:hypothetical protein
VGWRWHATAIAFLTDAGLLSMRGWFDQDLMPPGDFGGYAVVVQYVRDVILRYGRVPAWCSTWFAGSTYFVNSFT